MSIKIFLISLLLVSFLSPAINIFGQDSNKSTTSKPKLTDEPRKPNIGFPRYYPYIGLGIVNGERLGGIVQFHENFSAEASYGFILGTGWSLTNPDNMASIGASVHIRDDIPVFFSLIYTVRYYRPSSSSDNRYNTTDKYFSVNAGYLDLTEIGVQFMGRAGFYFTSDKTRQHNDFLYHLNLDISLGYSF